MPNRSLHVEAARLALPAAALTLMLATASIAAPPAPTPAGRGIAAWLHERGLDPSQNPRTRPDLGPAGGAARGPAGGPARAKGGGNPDDIQWQAGFGLPVPDGYVSALATIDSLLIVGGSFEQIGDLEAHGLAAWNGTRWSALGDFPGEYVLDLAPVPGGLLALTTSPVVWRWDGTAWSALPPFPTDPDSPAYYAIAMAVEDGQVAVSVWTWTQGIGYRSRVFLLSESGWVPLGGYFDDAVQALAWYGGRLYAAGAFHSMDSAALPLIAYWDGFAWTSVASGLSNAPWDQVRALAVHGGELVAGGWFHADASPAAEARSFARWNGTRWASLGTGAPPNANLTRLRVVGSDLYALGLFQSDHSYGIARWDGTTWHTGEDHLRFMTFDLAPCRGEMYVGGSLSADGTQAASPLARRRAGRWESVLTPSDAMQGLMGWDGPSVRAIEAVEGGIVAGGRLDFAGAPGGWVPCFGTARWDGMRWSAFGGRDWDDLELSDLAWHQGSLYAAGYFQRGADYGSVARFLGGRWVPMSASGQPFMNATCLASALGNLFLGGGVAVGSTGGVARWDGSAWHDVGGGITSGNYVTAMTAHGDELIAAGDFTEMGGVRCRNVAAWSPLTGWHALGDGLDGPVSDLTSRDGTLYAAMLCGGHGVARWKNGRWEQLDGPTGVSTLGWFRGRLVASGDGFPGQIAYLDAGGSWRPIGSGLNGPALSFVERDSSLFVGGFFSRAGDKVAYGFAEWRGALPGDDGITPVPDPTPSPMPTVSRVAVGPNPSAAIVHLRYDLPSAGHTRVEIYDLTGHLVGTPFDGEQSAGPQDVVWTPEANRVSAGVYFARVTAMGASQVVRVVRID
jgi:hypothetical protein